MKRAAIAPNAPNAVCSDAAVPAFYARAGLTRVHPDFEGKTILADAQVEHLNA